MRTALTLGLVGVLSVFGCGGTSKDKPDPARPDAGAGGAADAGAGGATDAADSGAGGAADADAGAAGAAPVPLSEQREVLARLPARHDGLPWLRVDDERVYVGANQLSADNLLLEAQLYAVPKAGGTIEPLGDSFGFISRIHEDGSVVFVVSPGAAGDEISAVSKSDGATEPLGSADEIVAMTASDSDVFVACLGGAYSEGPSVQRFVRATGEKSEFWPIGDVRALAVHGDELFLATNGTGVWRKSLDGVAAPVRVSEQQLPIGAQIAFTPGGDRLFWVAQGTMAEVSLEDGAVSEEAYDPSGKAEHLGRLGSSASSLVWSELDGNGVGLGVTYWSLETGEHTFAELENVSVEVVTDGSYLYGVTGFDVWRLPLAALAQ